MLLQEGKYRCILCGAQIDVIHEERQRVFITRPADRPDVRVIVLAGKVRHACRMTLG